MNEFPPQQIENTKEYLKSINAPSTKAEVGERSFDYFVIPQGLNPALNDFALRMTYTDPDSHEISGIFGVSDSVPEELRQYWAFHEYVEFMEIGISTEGRCSEAESLTLTEIPQNLRENFITRRITFFENLIPFFEAEIRKDPNNYSEDDIKEAKASLKYLTSQRDA